MDEAGHDLLASRRKTAMWVPRLKAIEAPAMVAATRAKQITSSDQIRAFPRRRKAI
jgi:hypothetical protein